LGSGAGSGSSPEAENIEELLAQVTPENGGQIVGPDGRFVGDPSSPRRYEEAMAAGIEPRPRGPKPIVGWSEGDDEGAAGALVPAAGGAAAAEPIPGPATPADAWKWQGVPSGRSLIGKVEPGKMRYYMGDDGHGPVIHWLPAAWPPDAGGGGEGDR
jgi:hypothetical protein